MGRSSVAQSVTTDSAYEMRCSFKPGTDPRPQELLSVSCSTGKLSYTLGPTLCFTLTSGNSADPGLVLVGVHQVRLCRKSPSSHRSKNRHVEVNEAQLIPRSILTSDTGGSRLQIRIRECGYFSGASMELRWLPKDGFLDILMHMHMLHARLQYR